MYSDMSIRTIASWVSNMNSASARASSVLPTPVGPRNRNVPIGRSGSCSPARERRSALATALTASSWPITRWCRRSSMWTSFSISPSSSRVTGTPVHLETISATSSASTSSLKNRGVAAATSCSADSAASSAFSSSGIVPYWSSAARPRSASRCARSSSIRACSSRSWTSATAPDRLLLTLPLGVHRGRALALLGERPLELLTARDRAGVVVILAERLQLDLELHDVAVDLVDLGRLRVDLHPDPRRRLVDQVDRLVGQEAVGDVAVAQRRRGDQRRVLDPDLVVDLVALLEPAQDRDRVLDGRLADEHRLEAALERGVLLDVLAVLVERRRADRAQLATREHRLEHVARVHRALGSAGADDRVQLVDEHDDLALGVGDLLQDRLQPVLEFPAVLGAGDHRAEVERDHAPVLQPLGHVAGDDPLGEALDDRRLADARLADQHRVVLGPAREHLDHAADLVVAADHRVELALGRRLGQVAAVALERLELVLGVLVGDAVRAAHLCERAQQLVARGADRAQRIAGGPGVGGQREQQMLGRDVLVAELAHLGLGRAQDLGQLARATRRLAGRRQCWQLVERETHALAHRARLDAELAQHGHHHTGRGRPPSRHPRCPLLEQHGE